jgi:hypothetical protein
VQKNSPFLVQSEKHADAFRAILFDVDLETGALCVADIFEAPTEEMVLQFCFRSDIRPRCRATTPGAIRAAEDQYWVQPTADPGSRVRRPEKLFFQTCRRLRLEQESR